MIPGNLFSMLSVDYRALKRSIFRNYLGTIVCTARLIYLFTKPTNRKPFYGCLLRKSDLCPLSWMIEEERAEQTEEKAKIRNNQILKTSLDLRASWEASVSPLWWVIPRKYSLSAGEIYGLSLSYFKNSHLPHYPVERDYLIIQARSMSLKILWRSTSARLWDWKASVDTSERI